MSQILLPLLFLLQGAILEYLSDVLSAKTGILLLILTSFLAAPVVVWKMGRAYSWVYLIPSLGLLALAFERLPFFLGAAFVVFIAAWANHIALNFFFQRDHRKKRVLQIASAVTAVIGIAVCLMLNRNSVKVIPPEHVHVALTPFQSWPKEDGLAFREQLFIELNYRTAAPIAITVGDTTYAITISVDTTALADTVELREEARKKNYDLAVLGTYRKQNQEVVKDMRAIIFDPGITEILESPQPFNDLYEFSVQPQDSITIAGKVGNVVEYILGVAVNYEMIRRTREEKGFRRRSFLQQINERYEQMAIDLGDSSLAQFHRGNSFYRAALDARDPALDLYRDASEAYRRSVHLFQEIPSPIKREPTKAYLNWGLTLQKLYEITGEKAYADSARVVYREACNRHPSYLVFRDRTDFLLKFIGEQFVSKRLSVEEFKGLCEEFVASGHRLQSLLAEDLARDPMETQNVIKRVAEEIVAVQVYQREYRR